jgi:hypothetical protein
MPVSQTAAPARRPVSHDVADRANHHPAVTADLLRRVAADPAALTDSLVNYYIAVAFVQGRTLLDEDIAETRWRFATAADPKQTFEDRVAERMRDMEFGVQIEARRPKPEPLADLSRCRWPKTNEPGETDPSTLVNLWHCPCPRDTDGKHVMPPKWRRPDAYLIRAKPITRAAEGAA